MLFSVKVLLKVFFFFKYFLLSTQDFSSEVENSPAHFLIDVKYPISIILKWTLASLGLKLCSVRTRCHCRIIVSIVESGILASVSSWKRSACGVWCSINPVTITITTTVIIFNLGFLFHRGTYARYGQLKTVLLIHSGLDIVLHFVLISLLKQQRIKASKYSQLPT